MEEAFQPYKNKSAISGAQFVPIGIPTICWYTMPPNCTYEGCPESSRTQYILKRIRPII